MAIRESLRFTTDGLHGCAQRINQSAVSQPLAFLYLLSCTIVAWLAYSVSKRLLNTSVTRPRSPDPEKRTTGSSRFKTPDRVPGIWEPIDFKRPTAPPYPDWDVQITKPLPYRPFRYGPYHKFPKFHADKTRRIEERGAKCCKTAPEGFDGACELLEEL